jgi:hypothetical protein
MRERLLKGLLGMMISFLVVLALLACYRYFAISSFEPSEPESGGTIISLSGDEIRNPEIALKYGVTGYFEITYPSDSPSTLFIDKGGEINIDILLRFVSHTSEVTETQVNIDPNNPLGLRIEQGDVIFNELVSYNPSGNITIKAGETVPVIMTIRIPEDLPWYIDKIPLGGMGIEASIHHTIDKLGEMELIVR